MCTSTVNSDGVSASLIVPEENKIILENGKEFEYDVLMIASGIGEDFDQIQGFREALEDGSCPVYTVRDFGTSKVNFIFSFNESAKLLYVII